MDNKRFGNIDGSGFGQGLGSGCATGFGTGVGVGKETGFSRGIGNYFNNYTNWGGGTLSGRGEFDCNGYGSGVNNLNEK